jgi:hypothetical protein
MKISYRELARLLNECGEHIRFVAFANGNCQWLESDGDDWHCVNRRQVRYRLRKLGYGPVASNYLNWARNNPWREVAASPQPQEFSLDAEGYVEWGSRKALSVTNAAALRGYDPARAGLLAKHLKSRQTALEAILSALKESAQS